MHTWCGKEPRSFRLEAIALANEYDQFIAIEMDRSYNNHRGMYF